MARVYATADDLAVWLGYQPPANALTLLTRASLVLDELLIGARYDVDVDSMPTEQCVIDATRDAVCAQVGWWLSNAALNSTASAMGEGCGGGDARLSNATINPDPKLAPVGPDVFRVLHVAGLYPLHIRMFG